MNQEIASLLGREFTRCSQQQLSRKRALFLIALALLLFVGLSSWAAAQSNEPIKIGVLLPKSGTYTVQGENGHNGAMLAVEDFGGKVLGRPVQVIWEDESTPQASVQRMRKMIEVDKVVAIDGGISSGDILAMMPVALQNKILLMASGPNATEITGKDCNRYTFRVDLPSHVTVRTIYASLSDNGKNKRWYFLSASYAWGIDSYNQMRDYLKAKDPGATIVGQDQAPLGTSDFSAFLLKLRGSNPQVAFVTFGGSDLTNFLKQFQAIGMTGKVLISSPIVNDSDLWAAGPQASTGVYPKLWNYSGPYNTPKSQAFAKKYQAKFGEPPEVEAWQDWFGMTSILTAIQKTGSTDSKKLVEFLEGYKFEGYKEMPIYFRSWDHQLIQPVIVARVKQKITDKFDYFDVLAQFPQGGAKELDAFYGTKQEVGCNLGPL
ncbi:MAG: ABC transporter substrate-binding protein [Candidatus Korobacteraceae bacterium]|jgi:branched-chain amino acid transport system substrate-binding protein